MTPLFKKLNFNNHEVVHLVNAPTSFDVEISSMGSITSFSTAMPNDPSVTFMLGFAVKQAEVDQIAQLFHQNAKGDTILWIAYPKGTSKKYRCEFNRDNGWDTLGTLGLEPVRQVAIDEDWSALRFRRVEYIKTMTRSFAMTEAGKEKARKGEG
jgi:hypothetical protein